MVVTRDHLSRLRRTLHELGATEVYVVGSAAEGEDVRDLDVACRGLPAERFLLASERLYDDLDISVDLFRLEEMTADQLVLLSPRVPV